MSDEINMNYVNKYVNTVKTRHDNLMNELISLEVKFVMMKETLEEYQSIVQQQNQKILELEDKLSKKSSRPNTSKPPEESI
jgi:hypothetical protein